MNTKKLIGTIIGVTMFAALIAGATFAWLTFGVTVGNNVYAGTTVNFLVDYTKGSAVTDVPMRDSTIITPADAQVLTVKAAKHTGSADGYVSIKLTTTSDNDLTKSGALRWAICRSAACSGSFANALNTGKVSAKGTITLLNDAMLASNKACAAGVVNTAAKKSGSAAAAQGCSAVSATGTTTTNSSYIINSTAVSYYVYFWLDGESVIDAHKNTSYTGYIEASAQQVQE